jgi:ribosomal protein L19E
VLYIPNVGKPVRITSLQSVVGGSSKTRTSCSSIKAAEYNVRRSRSRGTGTSSPQGENEDRGVHRHRLWVDKAKKMPTKIECLTEANLLIKTIYFKE